MVFKGRKPGRKLTFFLGLEELEIVESMKSLGIDFTSNWSGLSTKTRLAKKARARMALLSKAVSEGLTLDSGENLWRALVRPILEYGCEIWGGGQWLEAERIQLDAGRKLLGVSSKTTA